MAASKNRLLFYFFITIFSVNNCVSQEVNWINDLEQPYKTLVNKVQADPDAVLKQLLDDIPSKDSADSFFAQYHLLLSDVYSTLVYPQQAIEQAKIGLTYVDFKKQPWLYHHLQLSLAIAFNSNGEPAKGFELSKKALNWAKEHNDSELTINALITYAYIQISLTDYQQALESLQQAYQLAQSSEQSAPAEIAGIIALVYEYRHEAELSLPYFQEAVEYHREQKNWVEVSIALYGIGKALGILGKTDQAIIELQESADISLKINDLQGAAYAWKELAGIAISQKKYTNAQELIQKSLTIFKKSANKMMLFDLHMILSRLSVKLKKAKEAKNYIDKAINYINKENQPIHYIAYLKQVADVMAANGNYQEAYKKLWNVMVKEKEYKAKHSTQQLHLLRTKYDLQSKQQQNELLTQKNELNKVKISNQQQKNSDLTIKLFLSLLTVGLLLIFSYWYRKNKLFYEKLATIDGLTRVFTRNKSLELLGNKFLQLKPQDKFSLAMIDLDYFKRINDKFGHLIGDKVLKEVGRICHSTLPEQCIIGRFGGEEFILGIQTKNKKQVLKIIDNLRLETMKISSTLNITQLQVSISIGLCHFSSQKSLDEIIKCADDALYQAKSKGRNQIIESY